MFYLSITTPKSGTIMKAIRVYARAKERRSAAIFESLLARFMGISLNFFIG